MVFIHRMCVLNAVHVRVVIECVHLQRRVVHPICCIVCDFSMLCANASRMHLYWFVYELHVCVCV